MGLIEIPKFVDNVGPEPVRGVATSEQRPVEPDRSCKQFWRHPHLCCKATLKLTSTKIGTSYESFDPHTALYGNQQARCVVNRAVGVALIQHHPYPTFDGGDAQTEVRCGAHGAPKSHGGFAEN